jgi:hypothetical protein
VHALSGSRVLLEKSGVGAGLTLVTWQTCVKCDTPADVLDSHVVVMTSYQCCSMHTVVTHVVVVRSQRLKLPCLSTKRRCIVADALL